MYKDQEQQQTPEQAPLTPEIDGFLKTAELYKDRTQALHFSDCDAHIFLNVLIEKYTTAPNKQFLAHMCEIIKDFFLLDRYECTFAFALSAVNLIRHLKKDSNALAVLVTQLLVNKSEGYSFSGSQCTFHGLIGTAFIFINDTDRARKEFEKVKESTEYTAAYFYEAVRILARFENDSAMRIFLEYAPRLSTDKTITQTIDKLLQYGCLASAKTLEKSNGETVNNNPLWFADQLLKYGHTSEAVTLMQTVTDVPGEDTIVQLFYCAAQDKSLGKLQAQDKSFLDTMQKHAFAYLQNQNISARNRSSLCTSLIVFVPFDAIKNYLITLTREDIISVVLTAARHDLPESTFISLLHYHSDPDYNGEVLYHLVVNNHIKWVQKAVHHFEKRSPGGLDMSLLRLADLFLDDLVSVNPQSGTQRYESYTQFLSTLSADSFLFFISTISVRAAHTHAPPAPLSFIEASAQRLISLSLQGFTVLRHIECAHWLVSHSQIHPYTKQTLEQKLVPYILNAEYLKKTLVSDAYEIAILQLHDLAENYGWEQLTPYLRDLPSVRSIARKTIRGSFISAANTIKLTAQSWWKHDMDSVLFSPNPAGYRQCIPHLAKYLDDAALMSHLMTAAGSVPQHFSNLILACITEQRFRSLFANEEHIPDPLISKVLEAGFNRCDDPSLMAPILMTAARKKQLSFIGGLTATGWLRCAKTLRYVRQDILHSLLSDLCANAHSKKQCYAAILAEKKRDLIAYLPKITSTDLFIEYLKYGYNMYQDPVFVELLSAVGTAHKNDQKNLITKAFLDSALTKLNAFLKKVEDGLIGSPSPQLDHAKIKQEYSQSGKYSPETLQEAYYSFFAHEETAWQLLQNTLQIQTTDIFEYHYNTRERLSVMYRTLLPESLQAIIEDPQVPIQYLATTWQDNHPAKTDTFIENLIVMRELDASSSPPKLNTSRLVHTYRIANYARYPEIQLLKQLLQDLEERHEQTKPPTPHIVVVMPRADHNGAYQGNNLRATLTSLSEQAAKQGQVVTIIEAGNPAQAVYLLRGIRKRSRTKIAGVLIAAHGAKDSFLLSNSVGGLVNTDDLKYTRYSKENNQTWREFADEVETIMQKQQGEDEDEYIKRVKRMSHKNRLIDEFVQDIVVPACPIGFITCHSGMEDGTSQHFSSLTNGIASGSEKATNIQDMRLVYNDKGRLLSFLPLYFKGETRVYKKGQQLQDMDTQIKNLFAGKPTDLTALTT